MSEDRFKIIFEKLADARMEDAGLAYSEAPSEGAAEFDAIEALRQMVLEIDEPSLTSYTSS